MMKQKVLNIGMVESMSDFHKTDKYIDSLSLTKTQIEISQVCDELKQLLIDKNNSYGKYLSNVI